MSLLLFTPASSAGVRSVQRGRIRSGLDRRPPVHDRGSQSRGPDPVSVNPPMHIAVIAGDGIGKEVTAEAIATLLAVGERFGRRFDLEHLPWGADHYLETGVTIPADGYDHLRRADAIFIGALGDPRVPDNRHARDILLGTRFELDLYVNYRPVTLLHERLCPLKGRGRRRRFHGVSGEHRRAVCQRRGAVQAGH